jgi:ribosomal protein S18 acetylase RimI-like enzyme
MPADSGALQNTGPRKLRRAGRRSPFLRAYDRAVGVEVRRLAVGDEEIVRRLSLEDARFEEADAEPRARLPHTVESARVFLSVETNVQLAAFDGKKPVGQLLAYELIRRHGDGRMMFIYEIGVREDYRREGVGRSLFEALQAICRERGIARSFVITNERNRTAMAFYRAVGATRNATDDVVLDFDWS